MWEQQARHWHAGILWQRCLCRAEKQLWAHFEENAIQPWPQCLTAYYWCVVNQHANIEPYTHISDHAWTLLLATHACNCIFITFTCHYIFGSVNFFSESRFHIRSNLAVSFLFSFPPVTNSPKTWHQRSMKVDGVHALFNKRHKNNEHFCLWAYAATLDLLLFILHPPGPPAEDSGAAKKY